MRRARATLAFVALLALAAALAGCGSRRPMRDFLATGGAVGAGQGVAAQSTAGTDASASAGSDAAGAVSGSGSAGGSTTDGGPGSGPSAAPTGGFAGPAGSKSATSGSSGGGGGANGASDIGVTANSITLGNVVTKSGAFGPEEFTLFYYGAAAYFADLDAQGGINGRKVIFQTCDDKGTDPGNTECVRKFIDTTKVFALVASSCLSCGGMQYASDKGVPQVGGMTIDFKGYALPHYYIYLPNPYPQNGHIGYKGKLYYSLAEYLFMKQKYRITKAGVVYYDNSAPSQNAGLAFAAALEKAGIQVTKYPENVALPQFDSAVLDMKSRGITAVWDALDITGNQNLCKSIDSNGMNLVAKMSTISTWAQTVGTQFSAPCRNHMFSVENPGSLAYSDTSEPSVAKFRTAMKRYFPNREDKMAQWELDGWASAMWFADAAKSCGTNLTRKCLERFLSKPGGYAAQGLWQPRGVDKIDFDSSPVAHRCITVVQWQDSAKTWVTRAKNACYNTPWSTYPAPGT